jgi:Xaa-Pro aminopeptidase
MSDQLAKEHQGHEPRDGEVDSERSEGRIPPLPRDEFDRRVNRVQALMRDADLDGLLVYGNASFHCDFTRYLANYVHAYTPAQSFVVLSASDRPILLIDEPWQISAAESMSPVADIRPVRTRGSADDLASDVGGALRDLGVASGRLGVFARSLPIFFSEAIASHGPDWEFVDADLIWWRLVATPTDHDKRAIKNAARVASEGMEAVARACREDVTEFDAAVAGISRMAALGAEFLHGSGPCTHINFGSFSRLPSNVRPANYTRRRFERGMLFWVDMTCTVDGYYTDMDRTIGISPVDSERLRLYEVVLGMYQAMMVAMRPGVPGKVPYVAAMRVAEEAGLDRFVNQVPLGHTTGICTGVRPMLTATEEMPLADGSFVNIEPGIHLPEASACLEDTIYVGNDVVEAINTAPLEVYLS